MNGPDGRPDGESTADPGDPDRRDGTEVADLLKPQARVTAPHARATWTNRRKSNGIITIRESIFVEMLTEKIKAS